MARSDSDRDDVFHRYRAGFLKYRSVLFDHATGLPAFPVLFDELRQSLDSRRQIGLIRLELDGLGVVESLYGWQLLDRILFETASLLRRSVGRELPEQCLLALNGVAGDRFVVFVLQQPDGREVDRPFLQGLGRVLSNKLERRLRGQEFRDLNPPLTARTGHAVVYQDPFFRFERCVYGALETASDAVRPPGPQPDGEWASELERIIRERAVETMFQPIVDLRSRAVFGHEALSRGPRDGPFELPRPMFAVSRRLGVANDLDRVCREAALSAAADLTDRGKLFLNVLPGTEGDPSEELDALPQAAAAAQIKPRDIVFELSERTLAEEPGRGRAMLEGLRSAGYGIALDDVGTAFDSRALIESVRPNFLKLDGSLVRRVHENLIKQELLSMLIQLSEQVGATLIAEGVESEEEARALLEAGARYGQGYLYAAPGSASQSTEDGAGLRDH